VWNHTPEWEYFDTHLNEPVKSVISTTMWIEVLIDGILERVFLKGQGRQKVLEPFWVTTNLLANGMIPSEGYYKIDEEIDRVCREEDAKRRANLHVNKTTE